MRILASIFKRERNSDKSGFSIVYSTSTNTIFRNDYGDIDETMHHYYIFEENACGKRRVKVISANREAKKYAYRHNFYITVAAPWLEGVDFPFIKSYDK